MDTYKLKAGGNSWLQVHWGMMYEDYSRVQENLMWDPLIPTTISDARFIFSLTGFWTMNVHFTLCVFANSSGSLVTWQGQCDLALAAVNASMVYVQKNIYHPATSG